MFEPVTGTEEPKNKFKKTHRERREREREMLFQSGWRLAAS